MRTYLTLVETWLATIEGDGEDENIDVFIDPSRAEFFKLIREHGLLRGLLGQTHLTVYSADCTHAQVSKELQKQGISDGIPSSEKPINLHFAKNSPFLEVENWRVREDEEGNPDPLDAARAFVASHPLILRLYGPNVILDVRQAY